MPTIKCVEPAVAAEGPHDFRVFVPAGDALEFPHVDSCLAIGVVLNTGAMVGGHVSVQEANPDAPLQPHQNAMNILGEMQNMIPGAATISQLVLVGDRGTWRDGFFGAFPDICVAIRNALGGPDSLYVNKGVDDLGGGVDVTLNPRRQMVFIQKFNPPKSLVFQRPYNNVNGFVDVSIQL